jgi:hypothetical protein
MPRRALVISQIRFKLGRIDHLHRILRQRGLFEEIVLQRHGEEERACGYHYCDVREDVRPGTGYVVVELDSGEGFCEGWVVCGGYHHVVGDAGGCCALEDGVVLAAFGLDLVEGDCRVAERVHVEIDTAIVVKDEISNGIGALNVEGECVPGVEEPRILFRNKIASLIVRPVLRQLASISSINHQTRKTNLVLKLGVSIPTTLHQILPSLRDSLIRARLVKNPRYRPLRGHILPKRRIIQGQR